MSLYRQSLAKQNPWLSINIYLSRDQNVLKRLVGTEGICKTGFCPLVTYNLF